jgi:uncharacterized protein YcbX
MMYVQELWRYPVKSMAGELVTSACLTPNGIDGDRVIQVCNVTGRLVTSRTHPDLLLMRATIDEHGFPLVDGLPWNDVRVFERVQKIAGRGGRLVHSESPDRFDILPLLVATDGAIAAFGCDRRRLRPNLVVGGVEGLDERTWPDSELVIGDVVISVRDLRGRCVMTTFDPDTLAHDPDVLAEIRRRFGGRLALNCSVVRGGHLRVGDEVTIRRATRV